VVQLSPDPLIRLDRPARQSLLSRLEASPARRSAGPGGEPREAISPGLAAASARRCPA